MAGKEDVANEELRKQVGVLLAACEHAREALAIRADYWQQNPDEYGYLLDALDVLNNAIEQINSPTRGQPHG